MVTTTVFIELVIIGLQTATWLFLLVIAFLGSRLTFDQMSKPALWVPVLAFSYIVGIIIDRLCDHGLFRKYEHRFRQQAIEKYSDKKVDIKQIPEEWDDVRIGISEAPSYLRDIFDYMHRRMIIMRSSSVNFLLIMVSAVVYLAKTGPLKPHLLLTTIISGLCVCSGSVIAWWILTSRYCDLAYRICLKLRDRYQVSQPSGNMSEERKVMSEEQEEKKKRESMNRQESGKLMSNIPSWLMVFLTLILVSGTLYYQNKNLGFAYRPYVGIPQISQKKETSSELLYEAVIKNTGPVPANDVKIETTLTITGLDKPIKTIRPLEKTAVLFPEAITTYEFWLRGQLLSNFLQNKNALWKVRFSISYDGIHTKNHTTEVEVVFNRESETFQYAGGTAK